MVFTGSVPILPFVHVLSYMISESCASIETKRLALLRTFAIPNSKKRVRTREQGQKSKAIATRGVSISGSRAGYIRYEALIVAPQEDKGKLALLTDIQARTPQ